MACDVTSTSSSSPFAFRCRQMFADAGAPSASRCSRSFTPGTSSGGRMSRMVMLRNCSREYPYRFTAASFTARNRSVSASKTHIACGLASKRSR